MNYKRKKNRWAGKIPLRCKYWYKGMAKTNFREQPKRKLNRLIENDNYRRA